MSYASPDTGERNAIALRLPKTRDDWEDKRRAVDTVIGEIGGVVIRVGDETVGEMWSLYDGQDVLNEVDPQFARNITDHVLRAVVADPFHVSANTDPKGDRSRPPQEQDPDMLLHVVRETDAGIVVRGAKYETAAAYANQAFVKPTIANWGNEALSDYAVGFVSQMNAPGLMHICRSGFAGRRPAADYPLANRFDEVDTMVVFDDVLVPWENVLFYRHTRAATFIRSCLHRYSAFPFVQRVLAIADMLIGTALHNLRQTGLENNPAVREKLAELACYRETINAHLTAAIALAEDSPGGLLMPNQSLLYGRPGPCLFPAARDDAPRARALRRPDLPDPGQRQFREPGDRTVAGEVLYRQRGLGRGGPAPLAGLRPRPAQLGQCRSQGDLRTLRPVTAVCPPERGLQRVRLLRSARVRAQGSAALRQDIDRAVTVPRERPLLKDRRRSVVQVRRQRPEPGR